MVSKVSFTQLMKLNSPEWRFIVVGGIASVMHGATFPLWGLFFGDFFGILSDGDDDVVRAEVLKISMIFVGIGLMAGLGNMLQTYMFTTAGVKMITRLRKRALERLLVRILPTSMTSEIQWEHCAPGWPAIVPTFRV